MFIQASSSIMNEITRSFIVEGKIAKISPLSYYIFKYRNKQSFLE